MVLACSREADGFRLAPRRPQLAHELPAEPVVVLEDQDSSGRRVPRDEIARPPDEPVRPGRAVRVAGERLGGRTVEEEAVPGLDPVPLVVERVGGEAHAAAAGAEVRPPVDVDPRDPELPERREQRLLVPGRVLGMAERRDDRVRRGHGGVHPGERGERPAGSHLEQRRAALGHERGEALSEPHRPPQMADPVGGVPGLVRTDPRSCHVRDEGSARRAQSQRPEVVAEGTQDRVEHRGVCRHRDREALRLDAAGGEAYLELGDRLDLARHQAEAGPVDRGERQAGREIGGHLALREGDGQHRPLGEGLEEPAAARHHPEGVRKGENAGEVGGGVLAEAVADHRDRPEAPRSEELGEGQLDREQGRQGEGRPEELRGGRGLAARLREHQRAQVEALARAQDVEALVHAPAEHRFRAVQLGGHPGVLSPPAREEERDRRRRAVAPRPEVPRGRAQGGRRLLSRGAHDRAPFGEPAPSDGQREGGVREVEVGLAVEPIREAGGRAVEGGPRPRREEEDGWPPRGGRGRGRRRFLEDRVRVRAADAQRVHARAPRRRRRPRGGLPADAERRLLPLDLGVRLAEVQARGDRAVSQHLDDLDEAGDSRRRVEVADVRLDGADRAERRTVGEAAEGPGEPGHLDRVAHRRAGAVALDVGDGVGRDGGDVQRLGHRLRLPVDARGEVAHLPPAVVVHGRSLEDGVDGVAVLEGIAEPAEHHDARPAAEDRAPRLPVERPAAAVRGQDLALLVEVAHPVGQLDRHAAREGEVALVGEKALGGDVDRDEGGGAGGLDVDGGAAQVEEVRHAGREEVLVVPGVPREEEADRGHELGVREEVVRHVGVHARPGEHADPPGERLGRVARVLERLPGHLEEVPVLRVHDRGLPGAHPEEARVEELEPVEGRPAPHVGGVGEKGRVDPAGSQLLVAQVADRLHTPAQVVPEFGYVPSPRHPEGSAHDRDIIRGHLGLREGKSGLGRARRLGQDRRG